MTSPRLSPRARATLSRLSGLRDDLWASLASEPVANPARVDSLGWHLAHEIRQSSVTLGIPTEVLVEQIELTGPRVDDLLVLYPCTVCTDPVGIHSPRCLSVHEEELVEVGGARWGPSGQRLLPNEVALLRELAPLASQNSARRPLGSIYAEASGRLTLLLRHLHDERKVTWRELASATNLSVAALRQRVARRSGVGRADQG